MSYREESLKEIERRAYRSTFQDGIYDILFGLMFLIMALIPVLEQVGVSRFAGYALLLVVIALPLVGKRYITIPRMGKVEFGPKRKNRRLLAVIIGAATLFLTLPLYFMIGQGSPLGGLGWKMIAVLVAPLLVIAVFAADCPRLYIYTALLLAAVVQAEFLLKLIDAPFNAIYSFGVPGIVITLVGFYLLAKFVRTYPRAEAGHAE